MLACISKGEDPYPKLKEPQPPTGYTAEELELDNPYNQWMNEK